MRGCTVFFGSRLALAILSVTLLAISTWAAPQEKVLHSFGNGSDGAIPVGGLVMDTAGNLYGTTYQGGIHFCQGIGTCGTVFEFSPREGGGWTETVLHNFGNGTDGFFPEAGLVMDSAGNLYGTTLAGGIHTCDCGTVFELSPREGGGWTEKVLHSFNGEGRSYPEAGLTMDSVGNLYGTTTVGGTHNWGTVFELSPRQDGNWNEKVLHSFELNGSDGAYLYSGLIFDAAGNLYGTTYMGGINSCDNLGCGTVFELTPNGDGSWTETVLYSFRSEDDGTNPTAGLIFDGAGNLYGTTPGGGLHYCYGPPGCGTAFQLSPRPGGGWSERLIHIFYTSGTHDGSQPWAGLIFDAAGNLYGTTTGGGIHRGGTVFELIPNQDGGWSRRLLRSFGKGNDGAEPYGGLIFDSAGNLYGTTSAGGIHNNCDSVGCGTVFEITP
jgi:uncharacterized repeat protein (TIGR03803 family)